MTFDSGTVILTMLAILLGLGGVAFALTLVVLRTIDLWRKD